MLLPPISVIRNSFVFKQLLGLAYFWTTKYFCKTSFNMGKIKQEEAAYVDLHKIYAFKDDRQKEIMLNRNFARVNREIDEMIKSLLNSVSMLRFEIYLPIVIRGHYFFISRLQIICKQPREFRLLGIFHIDVGYLAAVPVSAVR